AAAGHPDDDAVGRQVLRVVEDDVVGYGTARRIDRPAQVEGAQFLVVVLVHRFSGRLTVVHRADRRPCGGSTGRGSGEDRLRMNTREGANGASRPRLRRCSRPCANAWREPRNSPWGTVARRYSRPSPVAALEFIVAAFAARAASAVRPG